MANDFTVPDGPPTQAKRVQAIGLLLVSLLILAILYRMQDNKTPPVRLFKELKPETFASVIAWLFAVALFVERAIEVVVLVFRDQTAELLDRDEKRVKLLYDAAVTKTKEVSDRITASSVPNAKSFADDLNAAREAEASSKKTYDNSIEANAIYGAETKEVALIVGFAFGLLTSFAGVRALHALLPDNSATGRTFNFVDIVVTGAMLAGGSEGIHRLANVFTDFTDTLSKITKKKGQDADNSQDTDQGKGKQ